MTARRWPRAGRGSSSLGAIGLSAVVCAGLDLLLPAAPAEGSASSSECHAPKAGVSLDHVVIAVDDLAAASRTYRELGFTAKAGRPHANGLLNEHLKLRDGTELELMTVVGEAGDEIARGYERFLLGGEGGAFLALAGEQEAVLAAAVATGVAATPLNAGAIRYVTFPDPGLGALFVVDSDLRADDPDSVFRHANGAESLGSVWLEAAPELGELLSALGAEPCGPVVVPDGRDGMAWAVGGGEVVLVPPRADRPRVLGAALGASGPSGERMHGPGETHGIWLSLAREAGSE